MGNDAVEKNVPIEKKIAYDIEKLRLIMDYFISNFDDVQVDTMFVKKTHSTKEKYKTYMFECSKDSIKQAVLGTIENISSIMAIRIIDKYDLEVSLDDTIQTIEKEKVVNGEKVLSKITLDYRDDNTLNENVDFDKLDFLIMQISPKIKNIPKITILKKYLRPASKYKNSVRGTLNGKEYKPLNKKILTIGDNVDAILIDDYYYITNRNNFNSMLEFKDVYHNIINDKTKEIVDSQLFDNPIGFIDDCKNNGRYLPRLAKAILAEGFKNVKTYHGNLPGLISKHKLKLNITSKGEIIYDKENVNEILNLLLQHYVTSDLTSKSMIAKAIEKYNE